MDKICSYCNFDSDAQEMLYSRGAAMKCWPGEPKLNIGVMLNDANMDFDLGLENITIYADSLKINYCPMCGRKL